MPLSSAIRAIFSALRFSVSQPVLIFRVTGITQELIEPPTFWTGKQIEKLVLKKYGQDLINGTEFDPDSIMRFRIPQTWTLDGFHTEFNTTLSEGDKAFIGGELGYPRPE